MSERASVFDSADEFDIAGFAPNAGRAPKVRCRPRSCGRCPRRPASAAASQRRRVCRCREGNHAGTARGETCS